jgi:hypothetical protein
VIIIDNVFISDEVAEEQFVCDLIKCKGGCCLEGDAGASLEPEERTEIENAYPVIENMLPQESRKMVKEKGFYWQHDEFGTVTPTLSNGICVYATIEKGVIHCAFEQAYNQGKINWKKPLSCHLFPLKITKSESAEQEYVNYEPRETLCSPACELGQSLKVPVYSFVKEALVRKYGEDFYEVLSQIAGQYYSERAKSNLK